jgi:hypothetical protein
MWWPFRKRRSHPAGQKVLLLIDWDNFRSGLLKRFGSGQIRLEKRIQRLIGWLKDEAGELVDDYGFVFAPEHLNDLFRKMCTKNKLRTFTCPKRDVPDSDGSMDSVDEVMIWFGKLMVRHPDVGFLCIVSGDKHFMPLMKVAVENNINVIFVAPSINCFSKTSEIIDKIIGLTSINPETGKKMFIKLDELEIAE